MTALVRLGQAPANFAQPPAFDPEVNRLEIFTKAPTDWDRGIVAVDLDGVMLKAGDVAIYDRMPLQTGEGLVEGAMYAVEYQRPVAGMTWEMWWGKGDHQRSRIHVSRSIVILRRHHKLTDHWTLHPLARRDSLGVVQMSDGPIPEWLLYDRILGRITGIYRPAAIEVAS